MGTYYVLREMPAGVDALSPDNVLTLFTGVVTGAPVSGTSRVSVNAGRRSPEALATRKPADSGRQG